MERETGVGSAATPLRALQSANTSKLVLFLSIMAVIVLLDYVTKRLIQDNFHLYQQVEIIGDYLRLTFIYNPGAAFGIHLGPYSRAIFLVLSVIALVALGAMYWATPARDKVRLTSISLICAG